MSRITLLKTCAAGTLAMALVVTGCSSKPEASTSAAPPSTTSPASADPTPTHRSAVRQKSAAGSPSATAPSAPKKRTPPPKVFRKDRVRVESAARARLVGLDVDKGNGIETVTFEFADTKVLPTYDMRYVPSVRPNPEDEPVDVNGNAFLEVGFTFTDPNTRGRLAVQPGIFVEQPIVKETLLVKNLGGTLRFALGLDKKVDFRARELRNPTRLVVEMRTS